VTTDAAPRQRPLDGVLVLDLGQIYAGPYCAWLLGQLGARVIKVEAPRGDLVRARTDDPRGPYAHLMLNAGKSSVVLDLQTAEGRDLLLQLVERADVLVENFSVGTMERLGLPTDVLLARNPALVHASGTGFGSTGPLAGLSAMDLTVQAMSGLINATGEPDRPPVKSGAAITDFLGGVHLALAVVAALLERERSGRGQHVESSMHEAAVISLCSALSAIMDHGADAVPERTGNRHPALSVAPYNVYPAADGYLAINCPSQDHWLALCDLMERGDLVDDERFRDPVARTRHLDDVDELVGGWTASRSRTELQALLADRHIPSAPVLTLPEVLADPHLRERGAFVEVDDPARGPLLVPTAPMRLDASPSPAPPTPAPDLGADTRAVLTELLGLDEPTFARLLAVGAFGSFAPPRAPAAG
jgi:CoA:oxalate CoA-transferase